MDLKGVFGKIKISEEISENLPLLSYLGITYKKNEIISDVIQWFEDSIDLLNNGNPRQELRTPIIAAIIGTVLAVFLNTQKTELRYTLSEEIPISLTNEQFKEANYEAIRIRIG